MAPGFEAAMYVIQEIPGKGFGLVATTKIPRGTRILSEEPIITIPEHALDMEYVKSSIAKQVARLSRAQREAFLSMPSIHSYQTDEEHYLAIVRTIALPMGEKEDGQDGGGGIFPLACRINHACDNNAQKNWNSTIKRHTVHALRDIEAGEEITIFYLGQLTKSAERQAALRAKFGFVCACRLCSLPRAESDEIDKRLDEIQQLEETISRSAMTMSALSAPLRQLRYMEREIQLYGETGRIDIGVPLAYFDAAQLALAKSDLARGQIFLKRALEGWTDAFGEDCDQVVRYGFLLGDPTKMDDVPVNLSPDAFEKWLWKRETGTPNSGPRPPQFANLRDRSVFPSFSELPNEDSLDLDFYEMVDGSTLRPRRHWCFLAEIVDIGADVRLRFAVRDVDGEKIEVAFHTLKRGIEWINDDVRVGHTVGIAHAERHVFAFSPPGIRQEYPNTLRIFPVSLQRLLLLSDRIGEYANTADGTRRCHSCGKTGSSLMKCARCLMFWYCNKDCQRVGWKYDGHKKDCKLLQDSKIKGLFMGNWYEYSGRVGFPSVVGGQGS
ncbi:uncharacterized protein B0T15DRAFT_485695 [Chaetomium strumarium]|uniref:Suppressor of anucleate metulae protein B n=1 Tax=Chaetomium strumarium TaxID=1170767 RepID=A0AAJ0GPS1_9PEZI|nr:hypothetical protein B0T15DRAFT_485695 [Chaetomium strumarium]